MTIIGNLTIRQVILLRSLYRLENIVGVPVQNTAEDEPEDVQHVVPEVNRQISIGRGVRCRGRGIPLRTRESLNRFENVSVTYQGTRLRFSNPTVPASTRFNTPLHSLSSFKTPPPSSTAFKTPPPPLYAFNTPPPPPTAFKTPPTSLSTYKTPSPLPSTFNKAPLTSFSRFNP